MSLWLDHEIGDKVVAILTDVQYQKPEHHFGRPFLTAYQLAIEFAQRYPEATTAIGYPVGGRGTGQRASLAQYLARELSAAIKSTSVNIEGGFLSNQHLLELTLNNNGERLESSLTGTQYDVSLFRLIG